MHDTRIRLLQSMPIFGGIGAASLDLIVSNAPMVSVAAGEYFFREGDPASSLFVLERGCVSVQKRWRDSDRLLRELGPGDCFGEMSLMDLRPRSASICAIEDCTAIEVPHTALLALYRADLEQFTMIQMNMGREVSRRLREADSRLFEVEMESRM